MNKHKFQLQKAYAFARKHAHGAVALLCGGMIGVLVVTFAGDGFTKFEEPNVWHQSAQELPPLIESISRESFSAASSASSSSASRATKKSSARVANQEASSVPSSEKPLHGAAETSASPASSESSVASSVSAVTATTGQVAQTSSLSSVSSVSSISSAGNPASSALADFAEASIPRSDFPPFIKSSWPIASVPNWGNMHDSATWNRSFSEMTDEDFVPIPAYNLPVLTIPMESLLTPWDEANVPKITAKLFYSTRYMGRYDIDAAENTGDHDGVDLKLAPGTPLGAIGGGLVRVIGTDDRLGIHVIIEHRLRNGETYFSIYGHLAKAGVSEGESVAPGQYIGNVGITGKTTAPHLHLQMAKGPAGQDPALLSAANSVHPLNFIGQWRGGE